ncbi:hypothetical protein [Paenisporosarcina sp.]|uniref:hypothetical protein n=1 Tax=Paenisporosarcina sp. TaxID=1932001 RepID=UPI003C74AAFD
MSRWQEESTSIFPEPEVKAIETKVEVDPLMWQRLRFLTTDFAKYVYKPLCFQLQDGEKICGVVDLLHSESVLIKSAADVITAIEINDIKEIWWGGKKLPIRL